MLGVFPEPPVFVTTSPAPPPPDPPEFATPNSVFPELPDPPPAELIVVKPAPETDEAFPLFPLVLEGCEAPPSPTVTVITDLPVAVCVDVLKPPAPPPPPQPPPPPPPPPTIKKSIETDGDGQVFVVLA